ncbi:MAG: flagellar biosynthesis protein FlhB [Hyphomicrobiales bacterium]|nr:MAG: flagellar biosynthesis protein FlhB [Hyphomicrobiales bacterium]
MADETDQSEKTEEPTQKRIDDAVKRGDVVKSQEVNSWFVIAGSTLVFAVLAPSAAGELARTLKGFLEHAGTLSTDGSGLRQLGYQTGVALAVALGVPMLVLMVMAAGSNFLQHGFLWTVEPLKPKLSKISPASGFKRLFSKESLVNFAKGLAKISIVAVLMVMVLWPDRDRLDTLMTMDISMLLEVLRELALKLLGAVLAVMTIVAGLDYMWQRHRWHEKLKMTVREIRDEHKQSEGDPAIKGKIRQIRMERARRRMMASVPEATVVITNPTHFAVALKYEKGMPAPLCVAKGVDAVALKIREVAKDANVPVIENPPLARSLFATVDIDQEIPEAQYRAVAEIIGYVMRQKAGGSWRAAH